MGKVYVSSITISEASVLNIPPIQNPTIPIIINIITILKFIYLRQKKHNMSITINGIIILPLLLLLLLLLLLFSSLLLLIILENK